MAFGKAKANGHANANVNADVNADGHVNAVITVITDGLVKMLTAAFYNLHWPELTWTKSNIYFSNKKYSYLDNPGSSRSLKCCRFSMIKLIKTLIKTLIKSDKNLIKYLIKFLNQSNYLNVDIWKGGMATDV